jgi:hypothetical protein
VNGRHTTNGYEYDKPRSTFETGKSYRTRGGSIAGPLRTNQDFSGKTYPLAGQIGCEAQTWTSEGRYSIANEGKLDLLPGAIEDERPAPVSITVTEADRMKARTNAIEARLKFLEKGVDVRLSVLERKHADMDEAVAYINGKSTDDRIEALEKCVKGILKHHGLMVGDYGMVHPVPETESAATTKRTIKGGWVNVYSGIDRNIGLGGVYEDKVDADTYGNHRIACIRIPDITEGEGL